MASIAYIIGVQDGKVDVGDLIFHEGDVLDIFACAERVIRKFTSFRGEVRLRDQAHILATAKVRIFVEE